MRSIIVDSIPILDLFPCNINLILFPKSSFTSVDFTALTFEDKLALGAARGNFSFFNRALVTGCLGNLIAKEFFLLVAILEIFEFLFRQE